MLQGGWTGVVLRIDLTRGEVTREALREEWVETYVGGRRVYRRPALKETE